MDTILELLFEASIRTIVIAVAVSCILWAMRVKSPAVAHRAWTGVLLIMLCLPVLSLWAPRLALPLLPSTSIRQGDLEHPIALSNQALKGKIAAWERDRTKGSFPSESPVPESMRKQPPAELGISPITLVLVVYFIGFCFFAVRLLTGMLLSYKLGRNAQRSDRGFYHSRCIVPLTIGLFRRRILLPVDSTHWNPDKLEAVLAHESEHVRRHDPLVAWLGLLNRCIYWFHPLTWWLCGKLTALAEQACDESVLAKGHDSGAYAEYLLEFARSVREKRVLVPLWGSPFHGSKLAFRIRRIVMSARTPSISRGRLIAVTALCVFATLVPAVGELSRAHASPPRLIPAISTALPSLRGSLPQPNQARVQAVPTSGSSLPNAPQKPVPPDVEASQSKLSNSDFSNSSDKSLYEKGLNLLERRLYKEARQVFEKLNATFPDSRFEAPSSLAIAAIADSFYNEGGAENMHQAEDNYKDFIVFFPTDAKAQDAALKIIVFNVKRMHSNDSNQQYAKARIAFQRFLEKYPDSDYVPIARQYLGDISEYLAGGDFEVAHFYADKSNSIGSLSRLKTIIDNYPNYSRIDEVNQLYKTLSTAKQQQEGQPKQDLTGYKLANLELKGAALFDPEKLKDVLPIKNGDPFDPKLMKEGLESIQQMFSNLGYIDFTYTPQMDISHNKKTVSCSFLLVQGRQYFVQNINIYGIGSDEDGKEMRAALHSAGLKEKMVFSPRLLDKAMQSLNGLLDSKNLSLKDYEFKRSSQITGTGDIIIRLHPKGR
jgi:outer membrane assembly lipoprotein YfiO